MKIALVHELLTMRGGAERVLRVLARMFPDAPIYTLLYDKKKLGEWFPKNRVHVSNLQQSLLSSIFRLTSHPINHHLYLKRFPSAVEAWDFSAFDLVISTSSAFAHGIITNGAPLHLSYIHSPARYLWDRTHDVLKRANFLQRCYLAPAFHNLRIWDSEAADRPDALLAASKEVQRRIELYWRRESEVLHPPIDDMWLHADLASVHERKNYYLVVSTLVPYKRIEIAVDAANNLGRELFIVGEGPGRRRLERMAGKTVRFLGFLSEGKLKDLYRGARAVLFPGHEDFGLVPLEAMACGTPVIAYRGGGALETITEGRTGEFFDAPFGNSLATAIERFERTSYDPAVCRARARMFSEEIFEEKLRAHIAKLLKHTHTARP